MFDVLDSKPERPDWGELDVSVEVAWSSGLEGC